jgi:glycosyltransferase involved in cell wall biosynthesis
MSGLQRAWRRLPKAVRYALFGVAKRGLEALRPLRVRAGWKKGRVGGEPVTILGLHSAVVGLGEGARLAAGALEAAGLKVAREDVSAVYGIKPELPVPASAPAAGGVVVSHINPPELMWLLALTGAEHLKGKKHIGYWAWELETAPKDWARAFAYVDEVWALSEFNAVSLRAIAPKGLPVKAVGLPVHRFPRLEPDRKGFGIEGDAPVVLAGFDLKSNAARKNPWAALEAYERAVPEADGSARLMLKVASAGADPEAFARLQAKAAARPDIILLQAHLSDEAMRRLMASVDIVLSLHRSEGFGLFLAEAMWLGKPVVATGWSGNMDFMDSQSAGLVAYELVEAGREAGPYAGGQWAEPEVGHAAVLLARLLRDPQHRAEMGRRALAKAEACFSQERWMAGVRESPGL